MLKATNTQNTYVLYCTPSLLLLIFCSQKNQVCAYARNTDIGFLRLIQVFGDLKFQYSDTLADIFLLRHTKFKKIKKS